MSIIKSTIACPVYSISGFFLDNRGVKTGIMIYNISLLSSPIY